MKRRITIEVDDRLFPAAALMLREAGLARIEAEVNLGLLVGPMQVEGQRTRAATELIDYGVILIKDEQVD